MQLVQVEARDVLDDAAAGARDDSVGPDGPGAQEVIGVAAVAGREVPYPLLRAAVSQPDAEMLAGLEAACRAHLLEEASTANPGVRP